MFTESELEILENALGEYMSDAYGDENDEGRFTSQHWAELSKLADKIANLRR